MLKEYMYLHLSVPYVQRPWVKFSSQVLKVYFLVYNFVF